jgi:hypothetical protein
MIIIINAKQRLAAVTQSGRTVIMCPRGIIEIHEELVVAVAVDGERQPALIKHGRAAVWGLELLFKDGRLYINDL